MDRQKVWVERTPAVALAARQAQGPEGPIDVAEPGDGAGIELVADRVALPARAKGQRGVLVGLAIEVPRQNVVALAEVGGR